MLYWELQNSDGKHWIIPTKNVSTALRIYQPSYWKGKLLKRILPLFGRIKSNYSPFPLIEFPLDSIIVNRLKEIFPDHKLEFSLFLGTPSVHKKTVIQIFEGNKILGYAKISEKECKKEIVAELSKKLPKYMWPNVYILHDRLPMNKNGKIDRVLLKNYDTK